MRRDALLQKEMNDRITVLVSSIIPNEIGSQRDKKSAEVSALSLPETEAICEATMKVAVKGKSAHTVAEGDGPVNALDGALRLALTKFFPHLQNVTLTDYKVRILDTATGTAAKTRVLIQSTDGQRDWGTVGVSENIIEASLQALVDSMEFALLKK